MEYKAYFSEQGWLGSENEALFSMRVIVEILARSFIVVEVEVCVEAHLQLARRVLLVEMAVTENDAAPSAFAEDLCEGAVAAIHADSKVGCEQTGSESHRRELCVHAYTPSILSRPGA